MGPTGLREIDVLNDKFSFKTFMEQCRVSELDREYVQSGPSPVEGSVTVCDFLSSVVCTEIMNDGAVFFLCGSVRTVHSRCRQTPINFGVVTELALMVQERTLAVFFCNFINTKSKGKGLPFSLLFILELQISKKRFS